MRPPHALVVRTSAALACAGLIAGALVAVSAGTATAVPASVPASASIGTQSSTTARARTKPELVPLAASGSMKVYWRGMGHGHGMSQYGAHGAAMKKLTTKQILAFYYPGTRLTKIKASTIRVRLSDATSATTVFAGTRGLRLSGYGALPTTGYSRFRLTRSGAGLALQGRKAAKWVTLETGLPARADFSSSAGWVQTLLADGTSTRYRGTVGALRSGSGELTINRVSLDAYAQGVAPREMPGSWEAAAVHAQAIAARTYAKLSMGAAVGRPYDICDTTMCQVYGGMAHYDSRAQLRYSDDPAAIAGNQNTVLTYHGSAIFAQYSASNGGATVDGGKPYLVGKSDPYDTAASGDPYLAESDTVSVSSLAASYGLRSVTSVTVTKRDGHGPWGGRVEAGYVRGTKPSGGTAKIATTGFQLGEAAGVNTDYVRLAAPAPARR